MSDNNKPQASENPNKTDHDINENILDLSTVIDKLFNLLSKETVEGKARRLIKKHVLDYIRNHKIIPQVIYNWLLNNQNNLNSTYLLGYFNYLKANYKLLVELFCDNENN